MRYTQIFEHTFSWKFPFHLVFIPEFPEFSVEWFAFRKFNNFRIFWNFSLEIFVPFVPVSKISEFLVEWKVPWVTSRKIACAHVTSSLESAATWVILNCVVTPSRKKNGTLAAVQVVVEKTHKQNPVVDEEKKIQRNNVMYTT